MDAYVICSDVRIICENLMCMWESDVRIWCENLMWESDVRIIWKKNMMIQSNSSVSLILAQLIKDDNYTYWKHVDVRSWLIIMKYRDLQNTEIKIVWIWTGTRSRATPGGTRYVYGTYHAIVHIIYQLSCWQKLYRLWSVGEPMLIVMLIHG